MIYIQYWIYFVSENVNVIILNFINELSTENLLDCKRKTNKCCFIARQQFSNHVHNVQCLM